MNPLLIQFSQKEIHPFFHAKGPVEEILPQIKEHAKMSRKLCLNFDNLDKIFADYGNFEGNLGRFLVYENV